MTQTNLFGEYVKTRLGSWGHHFALHRDCEYLGHQSRNMLQVHIDHRGSSPMGVRYGLHGRISPLVTGFSKGVM